MQLNNMYSHVIPLQYPFQIVPSAGMNPNSVIKDISMAIKVGSEDGGGKAIYVCRVVGENRLVAG